MPLISENEILVRAKRSLISRGSEIWSRYNHFEAIEHQMMGYSMSGEVVEVRSSVTEFKPGDRVAARAPHAEHGDIVVILGQGLVGSICMQVLKTLRDCSVIAIDTLSLRCNLALSLGADEVINADKQDALQHVMALTNGKGAEIVVYTVGGKAGQGLSNKDWTWLDQTG